MARKLLVLLDSFNDKMNTAAIKCCIEKGEFVVSFALGEEQYSNFDIIIFDIYLWRAEGKLKEMLEELIKSGARLICFPSRFCECSERDIAKNTGSFPKDLIFIESSASPEDIKAAIEKMVAG